MPYSILPTLNAVLNAASAVFLLCGFWFIKHGKIAWHRFCMLSAFTASSVFLASYLTYHAHAGIVKFKGQGWIRPVYFTILITHTILAIVIVPLVLMTLSYAWRGIFEKHRRIARITFPLWLYVSVTGVIVYFMLFH